MRPRRIEDPHRGVGGGRGRIGHRGIPPSGRRRRGALGRKIQARRTANRKTAASMLATVRATSSASRADGATHWATTSPSVVQAEAHQVQAPGDGEEPAAAGLAVGAAGELPVHGSVEEGGDGHGDGIGAEGAEKRPPGNEEEEVPERGDDAHAREAQELVGRHLVRARRGAGPWGAGPASATRRAGRPPPSRRGRPASRGRRPSPPGPRRSAGPAARPSPATRCRRTTRCPR